MPIYHSGVLDTAITDHLPIFLEISWKSIKPPAKFINRRSFKNFNKSEFKEDLSRAPWSLMDMFQSPDDKLMVLESLLLDVLDLHAPVRAIRVKKNPAPWIDKTIRDDMDLRNKYLKRFRSSRSSLDWESYRHQRNLVCRKQREAKREYFHRLISRKSNPSLIWKTLKASRSSSSTTNWSTFTCSQAQLANDFNRHFICISGRHSKPLTTCSSSPSALAPIHASFLSQFLPINPQECEDKLVNLKQNKSTGPDGIPPFILKSSAEVISHPLCSVINSSINTASFPAGWKHAHVKPLFKSGDKSLFSNYRPISLLPVLSKTLEHVVRKQLLCHLNESRLLYPLQSGFRSGYSTTTTLLHCCNDWYLALDHGLMVGVLFLDVAKAFDTLDHRLLMHKLQALNISSQASEWIQSYLSDRTQSTVIGDSQSNLLAIPSGVPQGTVLGPTLFSLFINDLPQAICDGTTILFADDTTIYVIGNDISAINKSLCSSLHLADEWLQTNHLSLNINKTKTMLIRSSRKKNVPSLSVHLHGSLIEQVSVFKFLGVYLNDTLTWSNHIEEVSVKVSRNIALLRRLSWFLPQSALLLFYKSFILPLFDYCDVVWYSCTKEEASSLERLQTYAAKIILRLSKHSSATSARKLLGLSTLSSRRKYHLAQHTYSTICGRHPEYLKKLFAPVTDLHNHFTRHASKGNIRLPPPKSNFGKKAFSFCGSTIWSSLPTEARKADSIFTFNSITKPLLLNYST